jgi:type VI secretion system protein ImpE
MTHKELFDSGKVRETVKALTAYLRERPSDQAQRTFLFELLCFSGEYERAAKQLAVLADGSVEKETGAIVYYAALHAEKERHELFASQAFPADEIAGDPPIAGELNGKPFSEIRDADPDLGPRLEVFAAGAYLWIPFKHLASVEMMPPTRLRDTLWAPALVQTAESFRGTDLGEVLIPAIYPFSWKSEDEALWLGRVTGWAADDQGTEYPSGQKVLLVDGEEVPFLEVRSIKFFHPPSAAVATPD